MALPEIPELSPPHAIKPIKPSKPKAQNRTPPPFGLGGPEGAWRYGFEV